MRWNNNHGNLILQSSSSVEKLPPPLSPSWQHLLSTYFYHIYNTCRIRIIYVLLSCSILGKSMSTSSSQVMYQLYFVLEFLLLLFSNVNGNACFVRCSSLEFIKLIRMRLCILIISSCTLICFVLIGRLQTFSFSHFSSLFIKCRAIGV